MRTITHGDVSVVARAVRGMPSDEQQEFVRTLLVNAHAADRYCRKTGRVHPQWGNGSLMAAAHGAGVPTGHTPFMSDVSYLEAFAAVIHTILEWRHRQC